MIKHMMPEEEERAETWGWEYMNCVVLQLIESMLDEMDESYMSPSDEARIRDFKKWISEYIEEMSEKLAEEKRDIPSLIRKACLYDQRMTEEEWEMAIRRRENDRPVEVPDEGHQADRPRSVEGLRPRSIRDRAVHVRHNDEGR